MTDSVAPASGADVPLQVVATAPHVDHALTFREMLSDLNPLQYLPGIGTLYRRITGDVIPESMRTLGGMVVSGLIGGPIGVAMNAALLAVEKLVGIEPEAIGQEVLESLGIGPEAPTPASAGKGAKVATNVATTATVMDVPVAAPPGADTPAVGPPLPPASQADVQPVARSPAQTVSTQAVNDAAKAEGQPWSPAQLAAYGVTRTAHGGLKRGALEGADVLNELELIRLGLVAPAVATNAAPPQAATAT